MPTPAQTYGDGNSSFGGGMDSSARPFDVGGDNYFKGVNVVCRGGDVSTRPSLFNLPLSVSPVAAEDVFLKRRFQGAIALSGFLIVAADGWLWRVHPATGEVVRLTTGRSLSATAASVHFCNVEGRLVCQDGLNVPVVTDGAVVSTPGSIPVGTLMAYGHGRLFVVTSGGYITAGDVHLPGDDNSQFRFTETLLLNGGGSFGPAEGSGPITALFFAPGGDTTTGDGPLLASTAKGVFSFQVDRPRDKWFDAIFRKQQVAGPGVCGPQTLVHAYDDVVYLTDEGLRTFRYDATETSLKRTSLSGEFRDFDRKESDWARPYSTMTFWNGRVLWTSIARQDAREAGDDGMLVPQVWFAGVSSLDVKARTGFAAKGGWSADGLWTGLRFLSILPMSDEGRCYFFCLDKTGRTSLWFMDGTADGRDNGAIPIKTRVVTREYPGRNLYDAPMPFLCKRITSLAVWVTAVRDAVPLDAWVSVDGDRRFRPCGRAIPVAPVTGNTIPTGVDTGRPHSFGRILFSAPAEPFVGYGFTVCVEWAGQLTLSKLGMILNPADETPGPTCLPESATPFTIAERGDKLEHDLFYAAETGDTIQ